MLVLDRLSKVVADIQNFLGPSIRTREDLFREHWDRVKRIYACEDSVDDTNLPFHLEQMVRYIKEEEEELLGIHEPEANTPRESSVTTGPCLELLLQGGIVETLVSWAIRTPNIRPHAFHFLTLLISSQSSLRQILPQLEIHQPLQSLLASLNQAFSDDDLHCALDLISTIIKQMRLDPSIIGLFMSGNQIVFSPDGFTERRDHAASVPLVEILTKFVGTQGTRLGRIARECIISFMEIVYDGSISVTFNEAATSVIKHTREWLEVSNVFQELASAFSCQLMNVINEPTSPHSPSASVLPPSPNKSRRKSSRKYAHHEDDIEQSPLFELLEYYRFIDRLSLYVPFPNHSLHEHLAPMFDNLANIAKVSNENPQEATNILADLITHTTAPALRYTIIQRLISPPSNLPSMTMLRCYRAIVHTCDISMGHYFLFGRYPDAKNSGHSSLKRSGPSTSTINSDMTIDEVKQQRIREGIENSGNVIHSRMRKLLELKQALVCGIESRGGDTEQVSDIETYLEDTTLPLLQERHNVGSHTEWSFTANSGTEIGVWGQLSKMLHDMPHQTIEMNLILTQILSIIISWDVQWVDEFVGWESAEGDGYIGGETFLSVLQKVTQNLNEQARSTAKFENLADIFTNSTDFATPTSLQTSWTSAELSPVTARAMDSNMDAEQITKTRAVSEDAVTLSAAAEKQDLVAAFVIMKEFLKELISVIVARSLR